MAFWSKWFVAPGTGAATAAADTAAASVKSSDDMLTELYNKRKGLYSKYETAANDQGDIRNSLLALLNGDTTANSNSLISDAFSTKSSIPTAVEPINSRVLGALTNMPDSKAIGNQVTGAYNALGDMNLNDAASTMTDTLRSDAARRGLTDSTIGDSNLASMSNLRRVEGAKLHAEGVTQGLNAEAAARNEASNRAVSLNTVEADRRAEAAGLRGEETALRSEKMLKLMQILGLVDADTSRLYNESDVLPLIQAKLGVAGAQGNVASQYQQTAANNGAIWGNLLGSLGTLAAGRK